MAAILSPYKSTRSENLRPFDMRRDINAVADLVEMCFAETLDPDGKRYLRQMRASAEDKLFTRWAGYAAGRISLPLSGFVWEEGNRIIGNLSLIPFFNQGRRIYMIANVAVHPDYRRRGIARELGKVALRHVKRHAGQVVWLQVRDDNPVAYHLYQDMGFEERARRTTWLLDAHLRGKNKLSPTSLHREEDVRIQPRKSQHWSRQGEWLSLNYPSELHWHMPLRKIGLQPGIIGGLYRFFTDTQVEHWSALKGGTLIGVLTWQTSSSYADYLWLATSPQEEDQAIRALFPHVKQRHYSTRPLGLDYPHGRAVHALEEVGFENQHTLIWMKKEL